MTGRVSRKHYKYWTEKKGHFKIDLVAVNPYTKEHIGVDAKAKLDPSSRIIGQLREYALSGDINYMYLAVPISLEHQALDVAKIADSRIGVMIATPPFKAKIVKYAERL